MISSLLGTEIDEKVRAAKQSPAYRVFLWSRWQDTDSDIVRGMAQQTPIDITDRVVSGTLVLDSSTDASSLALMVSVEKLNLSVFSNCIVTLQEGEASVDPAQWPTTFTGWRIGQPGSTESAADGLPSPEQGRGPRGEGRMIQLQFHSREKLYTDFEITSDGVWFPNAAPQIESAFLYRDAFDDVGSIAREICVNPEWGMGLTNDEVLVPKQPYRIEKQLQFVQITAWEALQNLLQVLHLVPAVNGEGKIVVRDRKMDRPAARTYGSRSIVSISQPDASFTEINSVTARGLAKNLTEVLKKDQRLTNISGTFGYFDPNIRFKDTWGADKDQSYRVKVGTVVDGNGNTRQSPRIRFFEQSGVVEFINAVSPPSFVKVDEFKYEVELEFDTLLVAGVIAALFLTYVTARSLTVLFPSIASSVPGAANSPHPVAVASEIASSLALMSGLFVLQNIGNFEFEIWGVPFETVYEEIRVDAILGHFGTRLANTPFREFERKTAEVQNYILSTEDDSVVPATATEPEVTNPGVRSFARRELAIALAEQAKRQVTTVRDILLEPGDIIEDQDTGKRYYIKSISRTLQRGETPPIQDCEAFLLPEAP